MVKRFATGVLTVLSVCSCQTTPMGTLDASTDARPAPSVSLNDLTVLVPLPEGSDRAAYLHADSAGAKGVLLPNSVFAQVPTFPVMPAEGLDYAMMTVVGIRFDPCQQKESGCEPQIRLVMQPINSAGMARDSALHLFYSLNPTEFRSIASEIRRLHTQEATQVSASLQVNPVLVSQGVGGRYGAALRALVLRFAGEQNLTRMTFFLRAPPMQEVWFFGGFERTNGTLSILNIRGVGPTNQRASHAVEGADGFVYAFTPDPVMPEDGHLFLSTSAMMSATAEQQRAAYASYLRVENPLIHGADALPCAGCHVSTYVQSQAQMHLGLRPESFPMDAFASRHSLALTTGSAGTPNSLRALGYFGYDAMISQRVVNETANALDVFDELYPPTTM